MLTPYLKKTLINLASVRNDIDGNPNPLLTSHDIKAAASTAMIQRFKPKPNRAKTKTGSLQNCNKSNLVQDLKKIAVHTYLLRYVRLYRFVFSIVRNQSHQSIMDDVVMNERTAELYTHWVEKISELATFCCQQRCTEFSASLGVLGGLTR